jgi:SAM-dependent methyltransferase
LSETALAPVPFVVETLRAYAGRGDRILDVGCGPALYRGVTEADYVGLDITDGPYLDGVNRDVDIVAPVERIPVESGAFDLVFSLSAFYQASDPRAGLSEIHRVLRPGGRLLLFDYNRRAQRALTTGEGQPRPAWTQWDLRRRVVRAGFRDARLLVAAKRQPAGVARWLRLIDEELRGQWAIVTAIAA